MEFASVGKKRGSLLKKSPTEKSQLPEVCQRPKRITSVEGHGKVD